MWLYVPIGGRLGAKGSCGGGASGVRGVGGRDGWGQQHEQTQGHASNCFNHPLIHCLLFTLSSLDGSVDFASIAVTD